RAAPGLGDAGRERNCATRPREPRSGAFGSSQAASRNAASTRNISAYRSRPAKWACCPATSNVRFGSQAGLRASLKRGHARAVKARPRATTTSARAIEAFFEHLLRYPSEVDRLIQRAIVSEVSGEEASECELIHSCKR